MSSKKTVETLAEMAEHDPLAEELRLTMRRELFCREYIKDLNGTQAAIRAGYKADNARQEASELLTNPDIVSRVKELQRQAALSARVDAGLVLSGLLDNHEKAAADTPVYDKLGNIIGYRMFDAAAANKALELLGKHLALFVDRKAIEGIDGLAERLMRAQSREAELMTQAARPAKPRGENS